MKLEGNQESVLFQKTKDESFPRELIGPGVEQLFVKRSLLVSLIIEILSGVVVEGKSLIILQWAQEKMRVNWR